MAAVSLKPVLVTGVAGFIGFYTARALLEEGRTVIGIDDLNDYYDVGLKQARLDLLTPYKAFTFYKADIADPDAMREIWDKHGGFREVVHLAAQAGVRYSLENPYAYIRSNLLGQTVILELCRHQENFEHLVYASSSSVYGANKKQPYAVTDRTDSPVSLYAATKRGGELLTESYCRMYGFAATGLRFFTVYGPWGRPDMAPHIFTAAIIRGEKVPVYNQGRMKRDFTYIDDIVQGVLSALAHVPAGRGGDTPHCLYNLGNNRSIALLDFIRELEKAVGKEANMAFMEMQTGDVEATCAAITESERDLGYRPVTPIEDGVPRFVRWYREYYGV